MIKSCCDPHLSTNMVTGIDCSKDYFDISVLTGHQVVFEKRFTNDSSGFQEAIEHVYGSHIAMEATGPYYFQLARFFYEQGQKVSVLNPLVVRRFSQMQIRNPETYLEGLKQRKGILYNQLHAFEAAATIVLGLVRGTWMATIEKYLTRKRKSRR